jgi:hypothetical protein
LNGGVGQSRRGFRRYLPVAAAVASLSCQQTFHFVSIDSDAGDAGFDGGIDAGYDGGDAGIDAGADGGDAGIDAGLPTGSLCTDNTECASGSCMGRCCSMTCSTSDPACGAISCDMAGTCQYPDSGITCGNILPVCIGTQLTTHLCDGLGSCVTVAELCPRGFACDPGGEVCANTCGPGACPDPNTTFCDGVQSECCPVFHGNALHVDGVAGDDQGCCGVQGQPCQTLTRTMQLVQAFGVSGLDLLVAGGLQRGDAGGLDWPAPEQWPVRLQLGVTVIAPNVHFVPTIGNPAVAFEVNAASPFDTASVAILGGTSTPVVVGIDTQGLNLKNTTIAIDDDASEPGGHNLPLALSNIWLNGTDAGVRVGPGASVTLNNVAIGSNYATYPSASSSLVQGSTGILCSGTAGQPATVRTSGYTTLSIDSQSSRDIDAEGYCNLQLSAVTLGIAPPFGASGVGVCPSKLDGTGLFMTGPNTMNIATSLTVQCMDGYGLYLVGTDGGAPQVTGAAYSTTIQNCGCAGVYLAGGALFTSSAQIHACQIGIQVDDDWRQIPGVFTPGPYSSVGCNSSAEPSDHCRTPAGADMLNTTRATTVDAQNMWWDRWDSGDGGTAGTTQIWGCADRSFAACVCQGPGCTGSLIQPLANDADAVYLVSNPSPFDLRGGTLSYAPCD